MALPRHVQYVSKDLRFEGPSVKALENQDQEDEYDALRLMRYQQSRSANSADTPETGNEVAAATPMVLADPGRVDPRQSRTIAASRFLDRPTVR